MLFWLPVIMLVLPIPIIIFFLSGIFRFVILTTKIPGPSLWQALTVHLSKLLTEHSILLHLCKMCKDFSYKPWGQWLMTGDFVVIISDPETMSKVYNSKNFCNKSDLPYSTIREYAGRGLLVLNGESWKLHRKLLNPMFRKNVLESNMNIITDSAKDLVAKLRPLSNHPASDVSTIIEDQIIDLSSRIFTRNDVFLKYARPIYKTYAHIFGMAHLSLINPIYRWLLLKFHSPSRENERFTRAFLRTVKTDVLEEINLAKAKMNIDNETPKIADIYLQMISKGGDILNVDEFCEEVSQLTVAESEPSSNGLKAAILMLALHQDVQQRVCEELEGIFKDEEQDPTSEDLNRMEYLDMVIKETLRLFPPGPIVLRKADEEMYIDDMLIPRGCNVALNIMALHRNPEFFEDPLKFKPERFLPELSKDRHPYAYIPFSSGARACLGQVQAMVVLKSMLSSILRSYRILPGERLKTMDDIKISMRSTLHLEECVVRLVSR